MNIQKRSAHFTLIGLLIVISAIMVLLVLLIPAYLKRNTKPAEPASTIANSIVAEANPN